MAKKNLSEIKFNGKNLYKTNEKINTIEKKLKILKIFCYFSFYLFNS